MESTTPVARQQFTDLNLLSLSLRLGSVRCEFIHWGFIHSRWWRNYLHRHSFFEVCYAFTGKGIFRIAGQEYEVRKGQVFIAYPNEAHEIISSKQEPLGIYFWSYTLLLPDRVQGDEKGLDAFLRAFLSSKRPVGEAPVMLQTLELLTEEIARKEAGYLQAIEGLTAKLVLDTARSAVESASFVETIEPPAKSQEEVIVQTIVHYLRDNYNHPIAVRDVAAQVHLSERHAGRLFRKVMKVSIMEYLTAVRLDAASRMLLAGHLTIKEIAHSCGYPDVRYFTTLFHRRIGIAPTEFRRERGTHHLTLERHISL
jgi:AraC-like DNA-binding protein